MSDPHFLADNETILSAEAKAAFEDLTAMYLEAISHLAPPGGSFDATIVGAVASHKVPGIQISVVSSLPRELVAGTLEHAQATITQAFATGVVKRRTIFTDSTDGRAN